MARPYAYLGGMPKPIKHDDPNELAASIVRRATKEEAVPPEPTAEQISAVMAALGRRGGPKGGPARAKALSPARRKAIAKKAAAARWARR
jgi:hypothetical protein